MRWPGIRKVVFFFQNFFDATEGTIQYYCEFPRCGWRSWWLLRQSYLILRNPTPAWRGLRSVTSCAPVSPDFSKTAWNNHFRHRRSSCWTPRTSRPPMALWSSARPRLAHWLLRVIRLHVQGTSCSICRGWFLITMVSLFPGTRFLQGEEVGDRTTCWSWSSKRNRIAPPRGTAQNRSTETMTTTTTMTTTMKPK